MSRDVLHNERELLCQIAEGDEKAFRALFHIYTPLLRPLIYKLTRTEHVIEDIIQEVFFKIWMLRDQLPAIENPRSWVLKIVFRDCFGYLRKRSLKSSREEDTAAYSHPEESSTEAYLDYEETARLITEAIERLPPQTRRVYVLSRQEGLKLGEIADSLGLSLQTVKNTLGRALKTIREHLEQQGIYLPVLFLWHWFF